jgi:hypothetical protein
MVGCSSFVKSLSLFFFFLSVSYFLLYLLIFLFIYTRSLIIWKNTPSVFSGLVMFWLMLNSFMCSVLVYFIEETGIWTRSIKWYKVTELRTFLVVRFVDCQFDLMGWVCSVLLFWQFVSFLCYCRFWLFVVCGKSSNSEHRGLYYLLYFILLLRLQYLMTRRKQYKDYPHTTLSHTFQFLVIQSMYLQFLTLISFSSVFDSITQLSCAATWYSTCW